MKGLGGFEGNAQTLRILTKLEKKTTVDDDNIPVKNHIDCRCGLNLTYRTLASILKYDREIPTVRDAHDKIIKGYYQTEKDIVDKIRNNILGGRLGRELKTIECQIMDIADDIAYSTYDLEDAFKAGFLSPLIIVSSSPRLVEKVAKEVSDRLEDSDFKENCVYEIFANIFNLFDDNAIDEINSIIVDTEYENITDGLNAAFHLC